MGSLHAADWVVIALYFVSMAWLGFHFSRKNKDTEEYFVGGRAFKGWVIGLSLVGTSVSSISFLAYPADAYKTAWLRMLPNFLMPLAAVAAVYVFIPLYRCGRKTTAYEYLGLRFGNGIRVYGSVTYVLAQFIRLGIVLYLVGALLQTMMGWPIWLCIVVAGVVVSAYTIAGGMDAVVWTDVAQTLIFILGGLIVLWVVVDRIPGGLGEVFRVATADGKLSFSELKDGQLAPIGWGWSLSQKTGLMMLLWGFSYWLQEFSSDQNVVQRYCAAASDAEARKALWWSVFSRVPIWGFFMFLGTALYVFFKTHPDVRATAMLMGDEKPEGILPYFVMNYLPPGLAGLIIAAAIAAAMSSLDSSMNSIAAVFVTDLYRPRLKPGADERHYLCVARWVTAVAAIVMVLLATVLAYADTKTIQDVSYSLSSIFGGGLLGLFFFGFFTRWGDSRAVGVGIAATVSYTAYIVMAGKDWVPAPAFDLYYTAIIGNLILFGVSTLASFLMPRRTDAGSLANLTVWTMAVRKENAG